MTIGLLRERARAVSRKAIRPASGSREAIPSRRSSSHGPQAPKPRVLSTAPAISSANLTVLSPSKVVVAPTTVSTAAIATTPRPSQSVLRAGD